MSRCKCDPCRNKFKPGCGGIFEIKQNECVYADEYMVDYNPRVNTACFTIVEPLGCTADGYGCTDTCDRDARLQAQISGSYIVQRIAIGDVIPSTGQINIDKINYYEFYSASYRNNPGCIGGVIGSNDFIGIIIQFQIVESVGDAPFFFNNIAYPCNSYAYAIFNFPNYQMTCNPLVHSNVLQSQYSYKTYNSPQACDSAFSLLLNGPPFQYDPCLNVPMSVTFTPII